MTEIANALEVLATGKTGLVISPEMINQQLTGKFPMTYGPITIGTATILPENNQLWVVVGGQLDATKLGAFHPAGGLVNIGFGAKAGIELRLNRETGELFGQVREFVVTEIRPLDGVPLPDSYKELMTQLPLSILGALGSNANAIMNTLGDGARSVSELITGAAERAATTADSLIPDRPKWLQKTIDRLPSVKTPSALKRAGQFAGDQAGKVGRGVASATGAVITGANGVIRGIGVVPGMIIGALFSGINTVLNTTPLYVIPKQLNGIPVRDAVEDIKVMDDQLIVIVTTEKNTSLSLVRWLFIVGFALIGLGAAYFTWG